MGEFFRYGLAALLVFGMVYFFVRLAWEHYQDYRAIPQSIIDARALSLIAEYGEDAERHAYGTVERLQWKNDTYEDLRAKRVLKSVRKHLRESAK